MRRLILPLLLTLLSTVTFAAERGKVTSWVPGYGIQSCKEILTNDTIGAREGIDRLCLMFWHPEAVITESDTVVTGNIAFDYGPNSNDIRWFREWGTENGVEILMTIGHWMLPPKDYGVTGWQENWELQKLAFHDNQEQYIRALLDEVDKYDLDGIDLDPEGTATYREEFAQFAKTIADSLHSRGKIVTIDVSPSTVYMSTNSEWWPDYVDFADAIHVMGYRNTFGGQTTNFGGNVVNTYQQLLEYGLSLGYESQQISFGLLSSINDWGTGGRGTSSMDHLLELRDLDTTVSVCLWDMQLTHSFWRTPLAWQTLDLLHSDPRIVLDEVDRTKKLTDRDTITLSWKLPEETEHHAKVISVRPYFPPEPGQYDIDTSHYWWRTVDTISPEVETFELDLSLIEDSLFTVMVAMVDQSGKVIDFDLTGTYFEREQSTAIATPQAGRSELCQILSIRRGVLNMNHSFANEHRLTITDIRGRELFRKSLTAGTATTAVNLPAAPGVYFAQITGVQFNKSWKFSVK